MDGKAQSGYGKRPLWQWVVLGIVVVVILYGGFYYFVLAKKGSNASESMSATTSPAPTKVMANPTGTMMQKFSDSPNLQYAYRIFPGTISTESKQAMAGFAFATKAMPDGSTRITLTSENKFYKTQQYTVKPGYTLYFIETNLKDDDAQKDTDTMYRDDTAILVDPQGDIAK
jgi:hypothetical protein